MAFEEFGQLSKRRRAERAEKFRKRVIIGVVAIFFLLACIAGFFAYLHFKRSSGEEGTSNVADDKEASSKTLEGLCSTADYKDKCKATLSKISIRSGGSIHPKSVIKAALGDAAEEVAKVTKQVAGFKFEKPEEQAAYEVCKKQLEDAKEELEDSISLTEKEVKHLQSKISDLMTWLSAVMSYHETCIDAFEEGSDMKKKIKAAMNSSEAYVSNSMAVVSQISTYFSKMEQWAGAGQGSGRRLLGAEDEDGMPGWVGREEIRKLMAKATATVKPDMVVAKDGSAKFTTINDALKALPLDRKQRFYIYIKEGVYEEYVNITKHMVNITMYGDGSNKTIITGNKSFVDGVPTYLTATFAAMGEGFIAVAMGFRNTAGPEKHQAVALRVQSDRSIFLSCRMEGYQDTLYAQAHRQFYRSCYIAGTVDFIFGDAGAIFQNCTIVARKPMDNQQNVVIAQGRSDKRETTGIIIHNSKIEAAMGLEPEKQRIKTYLGRPWKEYSRTIVMEAQIGDLIQPNGWLPWAGDFALKTLYYAEYDNRGPGADTSKRVNWAGYKNSITKQEAQSYTIMPFLQGSWIKTVGIPIPVQYGLYK